MTYSSMEPVLFEKLHNIKLSCSVFRITTFFQCNITKAALNILLQYAHNFDKNQKGLYSVLVTNNNFDHKSYDARQYILSYSALLKLCSDELLNCKLQIAQLTSKVNSIFATLNQSNPKHTKRCIIHSLFNFLFGSSNSVREITAIKNNMGILKENQDTMSSQIQKTFNFVNLTYAEMVTNRLLLRSLQKDIIQINSTVHCLSKEIKYFFTIEFFSSLCFS